MYNGALTGDATGTDAGAYLMLDEKAQKKKKKRGEREREREK